MSKPNIGVIGLAVMGSNLARNIESRGYSVAVFNRTTSVTNKFMADFGEKRFVAAESLESFVAAMERPRQIIIMVQAGAATDKVIQGLLPLVDEGDIIIDGGNAYYKDTERRFKECAESSVHFLGVGISGGEEGALLGPSIMPGGPKPAWEIMAPVFEKIAAFADEPCTSYVGPGGSGHFVKMVHNGIEYGDMQLIAEAYHLLKDIAGLNNSELQDIFQTWNDGVLSSFLIEITAKIFEKKDPDSEHDLIDVILDKAGQKGTGKWTVQEALDFGVAIPTIAAAVDARIMSSKKDERVAASKIIRGPEGDQRSLDKAELIEEVHDALYCSKIMSYAQGMDMLRQASLDLDWSLNLERVAALWKGGCIIRASFLDEIRRAFSAQPQLTNLMLDQELYQAVETRIPKLRAVVSEAILHGVPCFAMSASLAYYDSYRLADLPQNLTQAQRDFFGAHTFERKDKSGSFHVDWES